MGDESEIIEEVKQYTNSPIAEIDGHTENMEKLFKMDKWSKDRELYEIIINSYERHRNTLKRIQKMVPKSPIFYRNTSRFRMCIGLA